MRDVEKEKGTRSQRVPWWKELVKAIGPYGSPPDHQLADPSTAPAAMMVSVETDAVTAVTGERPKLCMKTSFMPARGEPISSDFIFMAESSLAKLRNIDPVPWGNGPHEWSIL